MGVEEAEDLGTVLKLRRFSGSARGADNSKFSTNWGKANLASWGPSFWETHRNFSQNFLACFLRSTEKITVIWIKYLTWGAREKARENAVASVTPPGERICGACRRYVGGRTRRTRSHLPGGELRAQPLRMLGPTARRMGGERTNPTPGLGFPLGASQILLIDYLYCPLLAQQYLLTLMGITFG